MGQVSGVQPEPFVPEVNVSGGLGSDQITVGIEPVSGVEPTPFRLVADGGDGPDVMNLLAMLAEFKLAMDVNMGQGDDTFIAEFKPAEFKPAEFKMSVDMGPGDNVLDLLAADVVFDVFELDARAGNGADRFDLKYQNVAVTRSLTHFISAGNGADRIGLMWDNVTVNSSVLTQLQGDAGADVIDVDARGGSIAAGGLLGLNIEGNDGNDRLRAQIVDLLLDGQMELSLSGGRDNDTVAALVRFADLAGGTFSGIVGGDQGDDDLLFDLLAQNTVTIQRALLDGGKGIDRCRASRSVTVVNCER
jgi:hypothetical protein